MIQLALPLRPARAPARQQPVIERLHAVLRRQGFDCNYRAFKGSIVLRPLLGPLFGWQPMCGRYSCRSLVFERIDGYRDRPPLTREEREELQGYLATRRECINELWGRP